MKRARAEREGCGKLSKGDYEELKRLRAENADLVDNGWSVSEKTIAELMRYQALAARWIKRRSGLTMQDKTCTEVLRPDQCGTSPRVVRTPAGWAI